MRDGERRKVLLNVSIILVTHLSRSSVTRIIHSCTVLNSTKVKQGVLVFFFWVFIAVSHYEEEERESRGSGRGQC